MRRFILAGALALSCALAAEARPRAAPAADARVAAALRAGDSAAAADALIEALRRAAGAAGAGFTVTQDQRYRMALARDLVFFAARARARPREIPQYEIAAAGPSELQSGMRNACVRAARLEDARITASAFRTMSSPGAAMVSCAFESQTDGALQWTGVAIRSGGAAGVRIRVFFATEDASVRRLASGRLSSIVSRLALGLQTPAAPRTPPPPGTTI